MVELIMSEVGCRIQPILPGHSTSGVSTVVLPLDVKVPCEFAVVHNWKSINKITRKYFISKQSLQNLKYPNIYYS